MVLKATLQKESPIQELPKVTPEAVVCRYSSKQVLLESSQYSQEKICLGSFLIKLQVLRPATLLKRLQHRYFLDNIAKFLKIAFFTERIQFDAAFVSLIKQMFIISNCRSSLLNQKHNMEWFLLLRFVDVFRVCYLHIIARNHSCRKQKLVQSKALQAKAICYITILTVQAGFPLLLDAHFNECK